MREGNRGARYKIIGGGEDGRAKESEEEREEKGKKKGSGVERGEERENRKYETDKCRNWGQRIGL